jgi:hypothetical protein
MTKGAPGRMGAWRLLDLVLATMPFRVALMGGAGVLPEYGPADTRERVPEPGDELPGSNISEHEQQTAIDRERSRRWLEARG